MSIREVNETQATNPIKITNQQIERIGENLLNQARAAGITGSGTKTNQGDPISFLDAVYTHDETANLSIGSPPDKYVIRDGRNPRNARGMVSIEHSSDNGSVWASSRDNHVQHSHEPTVETGDFNIVTDKTRRKIAASILWPASRRLKKAIDQKQEDEDGRYQGL